MASRLRFWAFTFGLLALGCSSASGDATGSSTGEPGGTQRGDRTAARDAGRDEDADRDTDTNDVSGDVRGDDGKGNDDGDVGEGDDADGRLDGAGTDGEDDGSSQEDDTGAALFDVEVHLASEDDPAAPSTVGIVTWSTTLGEPVAATIQFGLDQQYNMMAPVDLNAASYRTLLLGMKPDRTYHFRISAWIDGQQYSSDEQSVHTGAAPEGTRVQADVLVSDERTLGFILTSYWQEGVGGMAFIVDADGDPVWWYDPGLEDGVSKAAISDDGQDLWMASVKLVGGEPLVRVGIDGLGATEFPDTRGSHDIIPVEGDVMAYIDYGGNEGAGVFEVNRAGQMTRVLALGDLSFTTAEIGQQLNALTYDYFADRYFVSTRFFDVHIFPRSGGTPDNLVSLSSIVGPTEDWGGAQHRTQVLPDNRLLLFANDVDVSGDVSASGVVEFDLDSGDEVWRYDSDESSGILGDVQRLPTGNTLVTYSNAGFIVEVTPDGERVLEITAPQRLGYATWIPSLYAAFSNRL